MIAAGSVAATLHDAQGKYDSTEHNRAKQQNQYRQMRSFSTSLF